jgi:hypothetical protein
MAIILTFLFIICPLLEDRDDKAKKLEKRRLQEELDAIIITKEEQDDIDNQIINHLITHFENKTPYVSTDKEFSDRLDKNLID